MAQSTQSRREKIYELTARFPEFRAAGRRAVETGESFSSFQAFVLAALAKEQGRPSRTPARQTPAWLESAGDLLAMRCLGRLPGRPSSEERDRREFEARAVEASLDTSRGLLLGLGDAASAHLKGSVHRDVMWRSLVSTSDLPDIVADAIGKIATEIFIGGETSWRPVARVVKAKNFQAGTAVRLDVGDYSETGELIPAAESLISSVAEPFKLATWTSRLPLTYQVLVNDDLGMLTEAARAMAEAGLRTVTTRIFDMLAANADTSEDGEPLFSADHTSGANTATGSLDASGLGAAVAKLRAQKSLTGSPLNARPTHLIVSAAQEVAARDLVGQWQEPLEVRGETRIPSGTYYVVSAAVPALTIFTLSGELRPLVSRIPNNLDPRATELLAILDYDARVVDHRAWSRVTSS
jgi:hypothetical protein